MRKVVIALTAWTTLAAMPARAEPPILAGNQPAVSLPAPAITAVAPVATTEGTATATAAVEDATPRKPTYHVIARIDLTTQRMTVSVDGTSRFTWAISSGREEFPTPRGTFRAQWQSRMWYSRKYDLAPMPHSVFFHGGAAIHATNSTGMLGRPASHGCVRLAPANAATFYGLVQKHGLTATQIVVTGSPRFERSRDEDRVARRDRDRPVMSRYASVPSGTLPYYAPRPYRSAYAPMPPAYGYAPPRLVFPGDGPRYR